MSITNQVDIVEMLRDGGYGFVDERELEAAAEIERLRGLLTEWVADAHWNPRANLPDLVIRTKHAIGAARATDSADEVPRG